MTREHEKLSSNWKIVELGQICQFSYGKGLPEKNRIPGDYPVFGSNGIVGYHNEYLINSPAIVIGRKGSIGEINISEKPCWPIDTTYYIDGLDKNINFKWFVECLKTLKLNTLNKAAAVPGLNRNDAYKIKIPLPPLDIQKKIATVLDKADQLRQKRKKAIEKIDQLIQSVFLDMFGDPVTNPKGWGKVNIGDVVSNIKKEDPKKFPDKDYEYFDITSIDNTTKQIIDIKQTQGCAAPSRARQLVDKKDILISTVRPYLNAVAILRENYKNPIASTGFCVLRSKQQIINESYLFEICKSDYFIQSLNKVSKGASYPAVSDKDIKILKILLPPIKIQNTFSKIINKIEKVKIRTKKSYDKIDNFFNSLLQQAFKGELKFNDKVFKELEEEAMN